MKPELTLKHNIEERTMAEVKTYFQPQVFIEYCRACKYYNKIWTCPSYDFDTEKLIEDFQYVYIIGSKLRFSDLEGRLKALSERENAENAFNEIYHIARKVLDEKLMLIGDKNKDLLILLAGRCLQCNQCTRESQHPCVYPEKAHYSLESLGFDVASLCEDVLGDKIQWTRDSLPEYLTLVSAVLSREKLNIQDIYNVIS